jgi:hypothetical protein
MRAGVSAMIVAASLLAGGSAWSACPPGQSPSQLRNCVDLGSVPQISQKIVDGEQIAAPPKTTAPGDAQPAYTGPAVGMSKMIRRAPTVGYHWALD